MGVVYADVVLTDFIRINWRKPRKFLSWWKKL